MRALFPTAHEISIERHLRVQAAFQAHADNSVSKTINVPSETTVFEIGVAYRRAFELGCKGIRVNRHGSRTGELLATANTSLVCPVCLSALEIGEDGGLCRACAPLNDA